MFACVRAVVFMVSLKLAGLMYVCLVHVHTCACACACVRCVCMHVCT